MRNGYSGDRSYPDSQFEALVREVATAAGVPRQELLHGFGRFAALHVFRRLYPAYYEEAGDTRTFLLGVEHRIHALVRSSIPEARPPHLRVVPFGPRGAVVTYTSERRLCALLVGLVEGVAEHYGESVDVAHDQCMLRDDLGCAVFVEPR